MFPPISLLIRGWLIMITSWIHSRFLNFSELLPFEQVTTLPSMQCSGTEDLTASTVSVSYLFECCSQHLWSLMKLWGGTKGFSAEASYEFCSLQIPSWKMPPRAVRLHCEFRAKPGIQKLSMPCPKICFDFCFERKKSWFLKPFKRNTKVKAQLASPPLGGNSKNQSSKTTIVKHFLVLLGLVVD